LPSAIGAIRETAGKCSLPFMMCIDMVLLAALMIVLPPPKSPQSCAISIH